MQNVLNGGSGDGSAGKVLTSQARGAEICTDEAVEGQMYICHE